MRTINFKDKAKDVEVLIGRDRKGHLYFDLFLDNARRKKKSPDSGVEQNLRLSRDSVAELTTGNNVPLAFNDVNIKIKAEKP